MKLTLKAEDYQIKLCNCNYQTIHPSLKTQYTYVITIRYDHFSVFKRSPFLPKKAHFELNCNLKCAIKIKHTLPVHVNTNIVFINATN